MLWRVLASAVRRPVQRRSEVFSSNRLTGGSVWLLWFGQPRFDPLLAGPEANSHFVASCYNLYLLNQAQSCAGQFVGRL